MSLRNIFLRRLIWFKSITNPIKTAQVLLLAALFVDLFAGEPKFGERQDRGRIEFDAIDEASGLVASRKNPEVLWTHNDSGGEARVFAMNDRGKHLGVYLLAGAAARDWEDIAIGPGPVAGQDYLYLGDIGDNNAQHELKVVYRVPEPEVRAGQSPVEVTLQGVERIAFQFPDGKRDAETLMLDPLTRDLYIVSKRESRVRVYRGAYPQSTSETNLLQQVAVLNFTLAVAGDISPSGLEILIKNYSTVYYWSRTPEQTLWQAFERQPISLPYTIEPQGESICWQADGMGYYTVSEELAGIPAHLSFYPRLNTTFVSRQENHPLTFRLAQNFPNPFNPVTRIEFSLPAASHVTLRIYDLLGQEVAVVLDEFKSAGEHAVEFDASDLPNGVYFYKLESQAFKASNNVKRLVVLK
ncbi:MAG: T9SS type A sorting domain-containing protein [bacterium]